MGATIQRKLDSEGIITSTEMTVFTSPEAYDSKIWANVTNTSESATEWFKCYKIASGESSANASMIIPKTNVPPGGSHSCYQLYGQVFGPGDTCVFISESGAILNVMGGAVKTLRSS